MMFQNFVGAADVVQLLLKNIIWFKSSSSPLLLSNLQPDSCSINSCVSKLFQGVCQVGAAHVGRRQRVGTIRCSCRCAGSGVVRVLWAVARLYFYSRPQRFDAVQNDRDALSCGVGLDAAVAPDDGSSISSSSSIGDDVEIDFSPLESCLGKGQGVD
jgi:hypothetical protein